MPAPKQQSAAARRKGSAAPRPAGKSVGEAAARASSSESGTAGAVMSEYRPLEDGDADYDDD